MENNDTTLPETCPDCGHPLEHRTCGDCGADADVIDCGHYAQPAEIAASAYLPHDHVCGDCELAREGLAEAERAGRECAEEMLSELAPELATRAADAPLAADIEYAEGILGRPLTADEDEAMTAAYRETVEATAGLWRATIPQVDADADGCEAARDAAQC